MKQLGLFEGAPPHSTEPAVRPDSFLDLLPPSTGRAIADAFRRMQIAEQEIAAAEQREPEHARELHHAFKYLCPTEPLTQLSDEVYRLHCREILDRVAKGTDLHFGTATEILAVLAELSQAAPLTRDATLLYMELFDRLFPGQRRTVNEAARMVEGDAYERDRIRQLEAHFRHRLSHPRGP